MKLHLPRRRPRIPAWGAATSELGVDTVSRLLRSCLLLKPAYLAIDAFEMPHTDPSVEPFRSMLLEHGGRRQTGIVVPLSDERLVEAFCRYGPYSADASMGRTGAADLIIQCLDGEGVVLEMRDDEMERTGVELGAAWRRLE